MDDVNILPHCVLCNYVTFLSYKGYIDTMFIKLLLKHLPYFIDNFSVVCKFYTSKYETKTSSLERAFYCSPEYSCRFITCHHI